MPVLYTFGKLFQKYLDQEPKHDEDPYMFFPRSIDLWQEFKDRYAQQKSPAKGEQKLETSRGSGFYKKRQKVTYYNGQYGEYKYHLFYD